MGNLENDNDEDHLGDDDKVGMSMIMMVMVMMLVMMMKCTMSSGDKAEHDSFVECQSLPLLHLYPLLVETLQRILNWYAGHHNVNI